VTAAKKDDLKAGRIIAALSLDSEFDLDERERARSLSRR
jgi:hypothetical protein